MPHRWRDIARSEATKQPHTLRLLRPSEARNDHKFFHVTQPVMQLEKCGFTLLEILLTLIVFTVGVMAVLGLFSTSLAASLDAENTAIALNLSQKRLEEIRNLDFDTGIVNEAKAGVSGFAGFEREVAVTTAQTDLKQVTVTTYWTSKANEVSVPLVTYISRN